MKKIVVLIQIFYAVILITSCDKESLASHHIKVLSSSALEIQELYENMPVRNYSNISVIDGDILCFASKEQYAAVSEQLYSDCLKWDSLFYSNYEYMDETELFELEDSLDYTEFLPILVFEQQVGVLGNMLFDEQQETFNYYMENGVPEQSPTDKIFNIESDQAIHNLNHEVCVDDTIYQFREDAIIAIPISQLEEWREHRNDATEDIVNLFDVRGYSGGLPNNHNLLCDMPEHVNFPKKDINNMLTVLDFSAIGPDGISKWSVIGRRGLIYSHVITCKIDNYKRVQRNNGTYTTRRCRKECAMTAHISYSTEMYEQFYQDFLSWYEFDGDMNAPMPENKNARIFTHRLFYQHQPINYLSNSYKFGAFTDGAQALVRIGDSQTVDRIEYPIYFE